MSLLLENQTTNGSGSAVDVSRGGFRIVRFRGTFDGANVTLEGDFGDGNWVTCHDSDSPNQSAVGLLYLNLTQGMRIRATLASAGGSTDVTVDFR